MPGIPVSQGYNPQLYKYKPNPSRVVSAEANKLVNDAFNERNRYIPRNARPMSRRPIRQITSDKNQVYGKDRAWIKDMRNSNKILYLASIPQSTEESFQVSMYSESPVGSDIPVEGFSSMGARKVSASFDVDQSYLPSGYNTVDQYVTDLVKMIYPRYKNSEIVDPPECCFHLVNLQIIGICDSLSVTWGSNARSNSIDSAKVSFTIVETRLSI